MLAYFDTSALVPLLIEEPATARCAAVWDRADPVVSSSLAYVEVHAALAQAVRLGRIAADARRRALDGFESVWMDVGRIAVSDGLIRDAAVLAAEHALRGYDAVHCATALAVASDDFVAVAGDRGLLRAWHALGIPIVDTSG